MQSWIGKAGRALVVLALLAGLAGRAEAQGVTSAAVSGTVTGTDGGPIGDARVVVTNASTGYRLETTTRSNGRYSIENVPVGSPYSVAASAIGYRPVQKTGIRLALGQRFEANFQLEKTVVELQEVTTTASNGGTIVNPSNTGPAQTIPQQAIENLPTLGRNFTDLTVTAPQVVATTGSTPGTSVGGQNNRFNNIQIDGAVNNDLFGLGATGTPGGQSGSKAISIEAVKEFNVLIAPFDVRQGSFTGGLINAVTKSGTNQFEGSAFVYGRNQTLVGSDTAGNDYADFKNIQYGLSLGGPIIRDRAHFFVVADIQSASSPFGGLSFTGDTAGIGITGESFARFQSILRDTYGVEPGEPGAFTQSNPNPNIFGKLDFQLGGNSVLEVSHNYVHSQQDVGGSRRRAGAGTFDLTSGNYQFKNTTNTTRAKLSSIFGGLNNELLVGYSRIRDNRAPNQLFPTIQVAADGGTLGAGAERFSQANSLDQDIVEITDNATFGVGSHRITVGTHNEIFKFKNVFGPQSIGQWTFGNLDSLEAGLPNQFTRFIALRENGYVSDFGVTQLGGYVQDQYSPTDNFTVTAGVRVDVPFIDTPTQNPALLAPNSPLNINTAAFPKHNPLWSPRLGFNWDPANNGLTNVRGGVGIFSGRPPYVWISNAFGNTGADATTLTCKGANVPTFSIDPANQPTTCADGTGAAAAGTPTINYFDSDFKFPQDLKVSLGLDHQFSNGVVLTLDGLLSSSINGLYYIDRNLVGPQGTNSEGRVVYGTFAASGSATPNRVDPKVGPALEHLNIHNGNIWQGTVQLQKRFSAVYFNLGYTYTHATDRISQTSSIAFSNYGFATLNGLLEDRAITRSEFDRPHKITASTSIDLPLRFNLSVIYLGISGTPFGYVVNGDANADGVGGTNREFNDMIYVPANATAGPDGDISLVVQDPATKKYVAAPQSEYDKLNDFIASQACLAQQRGAIMTRNSCRNPWINTLNTRVTKRFNTLRGQSIELSWDIFNLLNLLDSDWGLFRETSAFEGAAAYRVRGYDQALDRPLYELVLPNRERASTSVASRWQMQLGARYTF